MPLLFSEWIGIQRSRASDRGESGGVAAANPSLNRCKKQSLSLSQTKARRAELEPFKMFLGLAERMQALANATHEFSTKNLSACSASTTTTFPQVQCKKKASSPYVFCFISLLISPIRQTHHLAQYAKGMFDGVAMYLMGLLCLETGVVGDQ